MSKFFSLNSKSKSKYWFIGLISASSVFLSTIFLFNPVVKAQVGVSPLVIQVQSERGQAQGIITIRNTTTKPSRVRIYTEPFTYNREEGFTILSESKDDLSPYLRFSPREMTIPPDSERRVRLLAQLLPSLPDGEYRTTVFAETLIEALDNQQNTVGIIARIGVTVYVAKGNLSPNLKVENITYEKTNNTLKLLVSNSGEASVLPKLVWKLSQNGQLISEGELPETTVIAGGDRNFNITPTTKDTTGEEKPLSLASGDYQLSGELIWQIDEKTNPNTVPFEMNVSI